MANEVDSLLVQAELVVQLRHGHCVQILIFPRVRILEVDSLHVLVKGETLALLEHAHQA